MEKVKNNLLQAVLKYFIAFLLFAHTLAIASPAPGVSGALSIIPGLGQVANGNPGEGLGYFVSTIGLMSAGGPYLGQMGFDLWMYNMYDAYRDAGAKNATKFSLLQNWTANFNPANVIDPVGAPIVGLGAMAGSRYHYTAFKKPAKIGMYSFVGLGEEGLFRGFLFPGFSDLANSKTTGAITSSALFALVHVTGGSANLSGGVLIQRFLMGLLFCWQADRNRYDLRNNIFAHTWFDILVDHNPEKINGVVVQVPIYF